jgi:hypothetical protein
MRLQMRYVVWAVISVVICLLLLAACNDEKSVDLPTGGVTPPPTANIAGSWTGTYTTNDDIDCDASISLPAKATFERNGSQVTGTLKAVGFCGLNYPFQGTLEGNTLKGVLTGTLNPPGTVAGILSGGTLEITPANGYGYNMGQMHLRR